MYGVFVDGQAVCEGYAKAYQYLMNKAGIVTIYICGKATGTDGGQTAHGWNISKINGNWYHTDCTWGDPTIVGASAEVQKANVDYAYLNITAADLSSTHVIGNQIFTVPNCTATKDNFYVKNGLYFTSFDKNAVDSAVKTKLQSMNGSKETKLYIKFKNHSDAATAKDYLTNKDSGSSHFFTLTAGLNNFVKKYTVNSPIAGCFCFTLTYA
jgi:transglutaminase/protease-like cytokinesis protein 3